jgi:hypothetical protein
VTAPKRIHRGDRSPAHSRNQNLPSTTKDLKSKKLRQNPNHHDQLFIVLFFSFVLLGILRDLRDELLIFFQEIARQQSRRTSSQVGEAAVRMRPPPNPTSCLKITTWSLIVI